MNPIELQDSSYRAATAVGNSWIKCDSKSHPGNVYYYNTQTRESVWNLNDKELQNAKHLHTNENFNRCPEPTEQPPMNIHSNLQIYNRQIVQNPMRFLPISNIQPPNSIGQINQRNPLCMPMQTYESIWGIQPPPYVLHSYPPVINPVINQPIMKNDEMLYQQNTESSRPQYYNKDLRQKLSVGKNKVLDNNKNQENNNLDAIERARHDKLHNVDGQNPYYWEPTTKLNTTPLKQFATTDVNKNSWYIVVDTNILVKHNKFLNEIIDSDKQCQLMIPFCVMEELRNQAAGDASVARILRFLKQKIDDRLSAFLGKENKEKDCNKFDYIFETCLELAIENYYVVLLSNSTDFMKYKNKNSNIQILTTQEVNHIISGDFIPKTPPSIEKNHGASVTLNNQSNKKMNENQADNNINKNKEVSTKNNENQADNMNKNKEVSTKNTDHTLHGNNKTAINPTLNDTATLQEATTSKNNTVCSEPKQNNIKTRKITLNRKPAGQSVKPPSKEDTCKKWRKRNIVISFSNESFKNHKKADKNVCEPKQCETTTNNINIDNEVSQQIKQKSNETSNTNQTNNIPGRLEGNAKEAIIVTSNLNSESITESEEVSVQEQRKPEAFEAKDIQGSDKTELKKQCLQNKCNEWISRFMLIIEEVTKEIKSALPTHVNLFNYSNMYNCGFNFVATLKDITDNHVYLDSTLEALKNLLKDFQRPIEDTRDFPESISDCSSERNLRIDTNSSDDDNSNLEQPLNDNKNSDHNRRPRFNLRSGKRKFDETQDESPLSTNSEFNFFRSLKLAKQDTRHTESISQTTNHCEASIRISECNAVPNNNEECDKINDDKETVDKPGTELCEDPSSRIQQSSNADDGGDSNNENLDYSTDDSSTNKNYSNNRDDSCNKQTSLDANPVPKEIFSVLREQDVNQENNLTLQNKDKFKLLVLPFIKETNQSFSDMQSRCKKYYAQMIDPNLSSKNRKKIHEEANALWQHLNNIFQALDKIIIRDLTPKENVQDLLRNAQFEEFIPDRRQVAEYSRIVRSCKEYAQVLMSFIKQTITETSTEI